MPSQTQTIMLVETATAQHILLTPLDSVRGCRKCEAGEGCGNRPWFNGLWRDKAPIVMPQTSPPLPAKSQVYLSISTRSLNLITFMLYGLPCLSLLLTLWGSSLLLHSELMQLLSAVAAVIISILVGQRLAKYCMRAATSIRLVETTTIIPTVVSPK